MIDYRLYLVTDNPSRYGRDWLETVEAALDGGVTCVQYRDTENAPRTQYERLRALRDAIGKTPLIVNNDAELAVAVKAEGVHVGQSDMPPEQVRAIVGPRCEIGLSITRLADLRALTPCADLIGVGPVFDARKTKPDAARELGTDGLAAIVAAAPAVPNVAIGGITLERAPAVLAAGAQGLAVVSALSQSPDPHRAAQAFAKLFD